MGHSQQLRLSDVRAVYHVLGECRDLADDAIAWRTHLVRRLLRLFDAQAALGAENRAFWTSRPQVLLPVETGLWTEAERNRVLAYMAEHQFFESTPYRVFSRVAGPTRTRGRYALANRASWHRSIEYAEYHRPSNVDDYILSIWSDPADEQGLTDVLSLHRAIRQRPFSAREVGIIRLLHSELGPMIGRQLASAAEPSPSALPPRVRQVLDCLLEGDAEKHIAARLGISGPTVHQYVGQIYRHFHVNSRAELLARWVRLSRGRRSAPR